MADETFDVEKLAAYLHLDPAQIARLADRGKLPGRKVGGSWRFNPVEVHHWLEDRIGLSNDVELQHMENALSFPKGRVAEEELSVTALLPVDAIDTALPARTRGSVITVMCDLAARSGWLWDPAGMAEAVRKREDLCPTAQDNGVALLHPRRPQPDMLAQPCLALGLTERAIPFGGAGGTLTDVFFLICSTEDRGHLRVLARLSRMLDDSSWLAAVRQAATPAAAHQLISEREAAVAAIRPA